MLVEVFRKLDEWAVAENNRRFQDDQDGRPALRETQFRVLGQMALLEVNFSDIATNDCDAIADPQCDRDILQKFQDLLQENGLHWDSDSDKIWMPIETEYNNLYLGKLVTALIAQPEYILISKALKAPVRNRSLIIQYIAQGASPHFLRLAKKYKVDLEGFLK